MAWWKAWAWLLLQIEQKGVSVKSSRHFNPDPDAENLYKAMKGIGHHRCAHTEKQRTETADRQVLHGSVWQGSHRDAEVGAERRVREAHHSPHVPSIQIRSQGAVRRHEDCHQTQTGLRHHLALMEPKFVLLRTLLDQGLGTREGVIIEILASRTKNELQEIMKAYEEDYWSSLEEDIQADTSGYLERILVCLLQGSRDDLCGFVDPGLALQDAQDLYAAGEKICGTDEMKFITILCTRSATHLMRVFEDYEKMASKSIEDSIKSETHGSLEEAMLTVVKCTRNLHSYFAERLYYAMKGAGTHDGTLIRIIVSRSEIDLNLIKCRFKEMYGKTLSSMIVEDTSSDYKNALLNVVGSDP
ncbi:annexin A8 isoform X3 [Lagenorhynchus albirostris]|uniref:annexin A8 isoform X3 n=1 Tax=Lagenorhynchus albirostris TaxID=27610 RepID=UPI0028E8351A|nr:annexin A8 isoform X3 [Lagenorhynchus albirostris]